MIRSSLSFNYAGVSSEVMGVTNVNIDSGLQSEPFIANRKIEEIIVPGRTRPYFHRVVREPLSFQVSFLFDGMWDDQKIRKLAVWLNQDYYQPLVFSDRPEVIYYALVDQDSTLVHNCLKQGYVTLTFRCNSPYGYSPVFLSPIYPASTFNIHNGGDMTVYPEIWIRTLSAGTVTITNHTNADRQTIFTGLAQNEEVYMDCESETIVSSVPAMYRHSNYNNIPLALLPGINNISVLGGATLQIQAQWAFL